MHSANILTWHVRRHRDDSNQTALWYLGQQSYQTWTTQSRCGDWPGRTLCAKRCPETVRGNFRLLLHNADNGSRRPTVRSEWATSTSAAQVDASTCSATPIPLDRGIGHRPRGHGQREPARAAYAIASPARVRTVARVYVRVRAEFECARENVHVKSPICIRPPAACASSGSRRDSFNMFKTSSPLRVQALKCHTL